MNLALALDNSFEIMNEEEMYDVNGGANPLQIVLGLVTVLGASYAAGIAIGYDLYKTWGVRFSKFGMKVFRIAMTATGLLGASFSMGVSKGYYMAKS